jgi:gamma-glutamylcyclotransferase (GGCT)/AIG2-like uncharacterized protein YtfP
MELTDLFFAYGADMNRATLRARCGGGEMVSAAFLSGSRMAFFGHDPIWDSGMETLVAGDAGVWGVLYRLSASAWEKLDAFKGATLDGAGNYFHYPVEVETSGGGSCLVRTYKKSAQGTPHGPSSEYLALLLKGAAENGLPLAYQDFLRQIPSEPATYAVPRTDGKRRGSLVVLDGGSCGPGCG